LSRERLAKHWIEVKIGDTDRSNGHRVRNVDRGRWYSFKKSCPNRPESHGTVRPLRNLVPSGFDFVEAARLLGGHLLCPAKTKLTHDRKENGVGERAATKA
jgi:hypothetical protein